MREKIIKRLSAICIIIAVICAILHGLQCLTLLIIYDTEKETEQAMYNSMSLKDKLIYNRIRYDGNFGHVYGRFYDGNVEKQKEFYVDGNKHTIDYCFSYCNYYPHEHNPENIPEYYVEHIYIDKNKNVYTYDAKNNFCSYTQYGKHYGENIKADKPVLSQKEAMQKGIAFCKDLIPGVKDMEISEISEGYRSCGFVYTKRLSNDFKAKSSFTITNDGDILSVGCNFLENMPELSISEERDVYKRLDDYIKNFHGDSVAMYEILDKENDVRCFLIEDEYIVEFYVRVTLYGDTERSWESIRLKLRNSNP